MILFSGFYGINIELYYSGFGEVEMGKLHSILLSTHHQRLTSVSLFMLNSVFIDSNATGFSSVTSTLPPRIQAASGGLGATLANATTYPLDLIVTRVQLSQHNRTYPGGQPLTLLIHNASSLTSL
jgi:hypothetical protein